MLRKFNVESQDDADNLAKIEITERHVQSHKVLGQQGKMKKRQEQK